MGDTLESAVSLLTDTLTLEQPFSAWCLASQSTTHLEHTLCALHEEGDTIAVPL